MRPALRRAGLVVGLAVAAPGGAGAAGPEVWAALQDARLAEAADRDAGAAIAIYETVLHHLPAEDPLRGELLLQLAQARFDEGDLPGARAALVEASADPQVGSRARAWRVQVDAWERRVQRLPLEESFPTGSGPLVLGWSAAADASLQGGAQGLIWTTVVREGRDDYVLAVVDEQAGPVRALALRLRALDMACHLRLIVEDDAGRRYTAPIVPLGPGQSLELDLPVGDLLPVQATGPQVLEAGRVRVVMLQDVTAFHSSERGRARVQIESLALR